MVAPLGIGTAVVAALSSVGWDVSWLLGGHRLPAIVADLAEWNVLPVLAAALLVGAAWLARRANGGAADREKSNSGGTRRGRG
jgi:hypothetical protein